ncbi:MAG: class II aldolase/adducin family protein [Synergistaceae bacterium]|nr:class II aldolase/adducin family protein [Synergistaceae bacterium]
MDNKQLLKDSIAEHMKRLYDRGLTTLLGGNISCRIDGGMLISPSSIDKHLLTSEDIIEMDLDGVILDGKHKPSIEHRMHSNIYKSCIEVNAIVHAHSFYATLFSIIDKEINVNLTAESAKSIGVIGIAPYAPEGTKELADEVAEKAKSHNVVLLKNHGVIALGKDLLQAFYRLEVAEQTAKLTYHLLEHPFTTINDMKLR